MTDENPKMQVKKFNSLKEFYPFYLSEHQNTTNRFLHFFGTAIFCLCFIASMLFHNVRFFMFMPVALFGFGWTGHLFFERKKTSMLKYPFFTIACDFLFFGDVIMGRQSFKLK